MVRDISLVEVFREVSVGDIQKTRREVVVLSTSTPLVEAFQLLIEHKIQSAPVWCEEKNRWIGYLDLRDLVSYCVAESGGASFSTDTMHTWLQKDLHLKETETTVPLDLEKETPMHTHISYLAARHPFKAINPESSLADALKLLATRNCHRVAVTDSDDSRHIGNIFSQTSVIEFLNEHIADLGDIAHKTVEELKLGTRPCVSVKDTHTALEALRLVDSRNLAGMAIVDAEDGNLIGNTSGSDLGVFLSGEVSLNLGIVDFLAQAHQARPSRSVKTTAINCLETDPLEKVVARLAATKVHHIFIVDSVTSDKKPLGVISVSDICRLLAKECTPTDETQ